MRHFLLLLFIPLLLVSCNKKELEEIELAPPVTWEAHKGFTHNSRFINNIYGTDKDLYVYSMYLFSRLHLEGGEEKIENSVHSFTNLSHYRFPVNAKVFMGVEGHTVSIMSSTNPILSGPGLKANLRMNMKEVDPHFLSLDLIMSHHKASFAVSENDVALIPYVAYDAEDNVHHGTRLLLTKFEVETHQIGDMVALKETKIIPDFMKPGGHVHYITSEDNYFYISASDGFFRISEEGEVETLFPDLNVHTIFRHKGHLYAVTKQHGDQALYASGTGRGWTKVQSLGSIASMLSYYPVNDTLLLAGYNSQLFRVNLLDSGMYVKELDNAGLEGHYINSVAKVKEKVYVGTQSGLFTKDEEYLLTYKEEEGK